MSIKEMFDKYENEFLKFNKIAIKKSTRPDMHAFILLDELILSNRDMISCAEHDQIWLDIDIEEFEEIATDEIICELCRCGVFYDRHVESLSMFV